MGIENMKHAIQIKQQGRQKNPLKLSACLSGMVHFDLTLAFAY
jgi:hypothetical protein